MKNNFINEIKKNYLFGGSTVKLIMWNCIFFVVIQILFVLVRILSSVDLNNFIYYFFSLSTDFSTFILRPWGIVTSIFSHFSFFHLIFNMLMLYFAGQLFERYFSSNKLVLLYFLGGLFGGIFELIAHTFFSNLSPISSVLGASGSIMAIFIGLAFYKPNLEVNIFGVFNLKLIYLALFYIFYELISIGVPDGTAHFSHIGGAFIGWLSTRKSNSPTNLLSVFDLFLKSFKKKGNFSKYKPVKKMSDEEFNLNKKKKQERIDIILDKISNSGYDSLTKEEKDFLFSQSK